jgi:ribosome-associated protein
MNDETMDDDEFYVSKTKRKQAMNELQDMGGELVKLGNSRLAELKLPEELLTAVLEAKRITSNGATRRQIQYIGRLMRDVDVAPIKAKLDAWSGNSKAEAARFHRLERWRERLLTDESALPEFIAEYPAADVQQIRTLIRNARKEAEASKPPKSSRALFKLLKEISEANPENS